MFVLEKTQRIMPSNKKVLALSKSEQWYYASYFHGTIHAIFGVIGAIYGFLYADGQFGTTWFHCNYYKLHMFDCQKYLSVISLGYFTQDFVFCLQ